MPLAKLIFRHNLKEGYIQFLKDVSRACMESSGLPRGATASEMSIVHHAKLKSENVLVNRIVLDMFNN